MKLYPKKMLNLNKPDASLEFVLLKKGYKRIIGIDEAGRGAWAGPVAVGAYVFDIETKVIDGINDSKLITATLRQKLFNQIFNIKNCLIEFGEIELINELGIGKTITSVIERIINKTNSNNTFYLIDGVFTKNFGENTKKIIKGDFLHYSISCASILAKVSRDTELIKLSMQYPEYSFEQHKGYGTKKHHQAIKTYGISKIHRLNYKPIIKLTKPDESRKHKK